MKENYELEQMVNVEKGLIDGNVRDAVKYIDCMIEELEHMKTALRNGAEYSPLDATNIRGQRNLIDVLTCMYGHRKCVMTLEWAKGGN